MGVNIIGVLGVFNVIDCDEEMWEVTLRLSWGNLM